LPARGARGKLVKAWKRHLKSWNTPPTWGCAAYGGDLPALFENAARGMLSLMVSPETVRAEQEETVEVEGTDAGGS